ncbi:MAG: hypothetical protein LUD51_06160 [Clostridia bacterium]|nr:hypothetical protein [Clostridia bacterium]
MKFVSNVLVDETKYYMLQAVTSPAFNKRKHDAVYAKIRREAARVEGYDGYMIHIGIDESESGIQYMRVSPCLSFEDMYMYEVVVATGSDSPYEDGKACKKIMSHEEMLETLSIVCNEDRLPDDIDKWKEAADEPAVQWEKIREMEKARDFVFDNMYLTPEDEKFPEYWAVMMNTFANTSAYGMNTLIVNVLDSQHKYEDEVSLFHKNPCNPVYAAFAGDIMCSGYLGEPDYKKAYEYYRFAAYRGYVYAMCRLAFMYRDGLYVEKDYSECTRLLLQTYYAVAGAGEQYLPAITEALLELSRAGQASGNTKDALKAILLAVSCLEDVWAKGATVTDADAQYVEQLYSLKSFAKSKRMLADFLYVLLKPCKVRFTIHGRKHTAEAVASGGEVIVAYEGQYYKDPADFMNKAEIDGKPIRTYAKELQKMEVIA